MPGTISADVLAVQTALSTELDSLASTGRAISGAIDNTDGAFFADLELCCTFAVAPTANLPVHVYVVPAVDGTNYADGDASVAPPPNLAVGSFAVRAVNTAQRLVLRGIPVPPYPFKLMVENQGGQALTASGHTLKYRLYQAQYS
jgi:hypothetical protein